MKLISLRQPPYMRVHLEEIVRVESFDGDDKKQGALIYLQGRSEPRYCDETAEKVREIIEEARSKEEIQLDTCAVGLLLRAANKSPDGRLYFSVSADGLTVAVGGVQMEPLLGRHRSKYEHAERQLSEYVLVEVESKGVYRLNERGYQLAEFFVAANQPEDLPFNGQVKLPARPAEKPCHIGVQFNQYNANTGDVNNAASDKGDVEQSVT